ncbi:MAG: type II toxin-antitoxin system prevent-host-death family antitoxin [Thermodesulfobacteriota bacterium]|nr:type II toxin-antitoxin system prevent-host-death family antitoxin [Thermodesulfobacteriota bacterium]
MADVSILDMANYMAYCVCMKSANIAEFKNHLGKYLSIVEQGEKVLICRRNVPLAMVVPSKQRPVTINKTRLGCGEGSVVIHTDLTEPSFPPNDWNMLQGKL